MRVSAPADEYFGRMKMSFLGMNNTFRDAAITAGDHTTAPAIVAKVALAEDALEAWSKKYPRDPQLARTYYLATQVDRKIWIKANQEQAWIYLNRIAKVFPATYFGKTVKRSLAVGFTEPDAEPHALTEPDADTGSNRDDPRARPQARARTERLRRTANADARARNAGAGAGAESVILAPARGPRLSPGRNHRSCC